MPLFDFNMYINIINNWSYFKKQIYQNYIIKTSNTNNIKITLVLLIKRIIFYIKFFMIEVRKSNI